VSTPRHRRSIWIPVLLTVVAVAAVGSYFNHQANSGDKGKRETATLRTASIARGDVDHTVRISGVIAAERFAAIMAPRLRGTRVGSGGVLASQDIVGNAPITITAPYLPPSKGGTAGTASTSTATNSATANDPSTASTATSAATTASTPDQSSGNNASGSTGTSGSSSSSSGSSSATGPQSSLGAIRGSTNRFGDRQNSGKSASASATQSANSMGASGLGSTSVDLNSSSQRNSGGGGTTGGGGGGGSDFTLVLTQVANPGSHVKKGDIVAEFDRQYQIQRIDDFKATVVQLDANIKKMYADMAVLKHAHTQLVESARADLEKAQLDLKTAEVRSAIEGEQLKLAVEENDAHYQQLLKEIKLVDATQQAQLRATEVDRDQGKLELDRAKLNVERMVLHTPIDGVVVMQSIWRGGDFGQVQQGDQVWPGMTFMLVVDPSSMVINGNMNQVDAEYVHLGQKAIARLDGYAGLELKAHIAGIGAMTKPGVWRPSYMREIPIRLKLDQMDAKVIPDLSASTDVMIESVKQAAVVPLGAVVQEGAGTKPFVFLRGPSGWQQREVELGLRNNLVAAVRSGLAAGDVVALDRPGGAEKHQQ
jgi:HlyD family secretion protein